MKVMIAIQLMDGSMGTRWTDNNKAAKALARFAKNQWTFDLADFADLDLDIYFEVKRGANRAAPMTIEFDIEDDDRQRHVLSHIKTLDEIVGLFMDSAAAAKLMKPQKIESGGI